MPSASPKQLTLLSIATEQLKTGFSVITTSQVVIHPFASVTVTVCVPASRRMAVENISPLSHAYVIGAVPPLGITVAEPSDRPSQLTLLFTAVVHENCGSVISTVHTAEHIGLACSLTVTI